MDWLGFLPVTPRSSTSHPRLNPLPANGRIGVNVLSHLSSGSSGGLRVYKGAFRGRRIGKPG